MAKITPAFLVLGDAPPGAPETAAALAADMSGWCAAEPEVFG